MQFYGTIFVLEFYHILLLPEKKLRMHTYYISQKYNSQKHTRDLIIVHCINARTYTILISSLYFSSQTTKANTEIEKETKQKTTEKETN